ncbi:MAG: hypothetical protein KTR14_06520 [Vampirovibrio sp.]|nr:hypothetical protein [Vampirovibrio sp.]
MQPLPQAISETAPLSKARSRVFFSSWSASSKQQAEKIQGWLTEYQCEQLRLVVLNVLKFPLPPLIGYFLLDATGVTASIAQVNPVIFKIMGEGFGHAGLCFSIHYFVQAASHLVKVFRPAE